jgi:hypothetical protein
MSRRYKRQSLESSLFHHDLIKILLIHHLTIMGDCWDGFLTRNGFSTTIPVEIPNSGESLIKKWFDILDSLNRNPLDEAIPSQSSYEKKDVEFEVREPPMPKFDADQNATVKSDVKKIGKRIEQKHIALGFQKKSEGRLF